MFPAYSGNNAYCYSNSLHMCLEHAGMAHLPQVSLVECMTGMPFGACFLKHEAPLFFPSPASIDPQSGLTRALAILGWTCTVWQGDDADIALTALQEALSVGPVLLGPLDMGFLPYDPNYANKRGETTLLSSSSSKRTGCRCMTHSSTPLPCCRLQT